MNHDQALRDHLRDLLDSGNAHVEFDRAIADLPESLRGARHPSVPQSPWRLVEHLRIAQWDILQFCLDPNHVSPEFPEGYWPTGDTPPDPEAWDRTIAGFREDRDTLIRLATHPSTDIFTPLPHGDGQTILREVLLVADHNAYHLGQLIVLRRLLGAWED